MKNMAKYSCVTEFGVLDYETKRRKFLEGVSCYELYLSNGDLRFHIANLHKFKSRSGWRVVLVHNKLRDISAIPKSARNLRGFMTKEDAIFAVTDLMCLDSGNIDDSLEDFKSWDKFKDEIKSSNEMPKTVKAE